MRAGWGGDDSDREGGVDAGVFEEDGGAVADGGGDDEDGGELSGSGAAEAADEPVQGTEGTHDAAPS
jgi:hypothetical protein